MGFRPSCWLFPHLWISLLLFFHDGTLSLPVQIVVNQRNPECLYEVLDAEEAVTVSVIVLAGNELVADLKFEGPIAPKDVESSARLQELINEYEADHSGKDGSAGYINYRRKIDFEHLNLGDVDKGHEDDDDDDEVIDHKELTAEERKERRAKQRKKALEARQRRENHKVKQREHVRNEGDPEEKTFRVEAGGWYRFCVTGQYVTAEVDLRKESELGGIDEETGHVNTFQKMVLDQEERSLEEDTAAEEGIKDEDFLMTRDKLKQLRRLLADIQSKQTQERHRLVVHSATNEHSHSRMVLSSLLETVLFMLVTGFQVYTIRKWFKGAPMLGR